MKVLRLTLLTTLLFFGLVSTVLYTACEKDVCNNVSCQNGGSCNMGVCRCPVGYENTQCQTKSITRYLGTFAGTISCDNLTQILDTAWITADNVAPNTVAVKLKSIYKTKGLLHGYVKNNESVYSIVVTNNDSSATFAHIYSINLQADRNLIIHSYDLDYTSPTDSSKNQCMFRGVKR